MVKRRVVVLVSFNPGHVVAEAWLLFPQPADVGKNVSVMRVFSSWRVALKKAWSCRTTLLLSILVLTWVFGWETSGDSIRRSTIRRNVRRAAYPNNLDRLELAVSGLPSTGPHPSQTILYTDQICLCTSYPKEPFQLPLAGAIHTF